MLEKPLLKYASDLGGPFLGNKYPQKLAARGMERGRKNRKTTAALLARGSHTVVRILSLCVYVSDDPLLILLGPSNGDYWSDQGTWGP